MRFLKMLVCLTLCACLTIVAYAHSGKTDADGGHTDSSTGEYHYHHGYPAHQHSDLDGDGILDCPYKFDDKTGSSGTNGNSSSKTPTKGTILAHDSSEENTFSKKLEKFWSDIRENLLILACVFGFYGVMGNIGMIPELVKRIFKKISKK